MTFVDNDTVSRDTNMQSLRSVYFLKSKSTVFCFLCLFCLKGEAIMLLFLYLDVNEEFTTKTLKGS